MDRLWKHDHSSRNPCVWLCIGSCVYGAVAYVRLQKDNEDPYVVLLTSKTKVAPLPKRKVTLPRLELFSSLLAVCLGEAVRKALPNQRWKVNYWSDSLVALGWIRGEPNRWKLFVRNQVETIQSVSEKEWWKHCPVVQNPADLASRVVPAPALVNSQLWWNGPEWQKEEESSWLNSTEQDKQDTSVQENIEIESRGAAVSVTAAMTASKEPIDWDIRRVSSWNRLLRSTARIMRFSNRCRKRTRDPGLSFTEKIQIKDFKKDKSKRKPPKDITKARLLDEELGEAELRIYRQLQKERYPNAFETLQLGLPFHPKEKIESLLPVWDERDKLIRVTGRVALALRDRNKEPSILCH